MSKKDPSTANKKGPPHPNVNQWPVCRTWTDDESPTGSVVTAIAAITGLAPHQMRPLYESIDPDGLDALFESVSDRSRQSSDISVSFCHEGCEIVVQGTGQLFVRLQDDDSR